MSEEIYYAEARQIAARIRSKDLSPVEVVQAHLDRIDAVNPTLNAVVTLWDGAMERAREAEAAIMRGEVWGPLHGVPFTVKDCIDTAGVRTTVGSKLFEELVPEQDAPAVRRLRGAGGIFLGHTNMPEFALWWESGNLVFGRTSNPWDLERTAGGSSGGEAAAISTGMSAMGIGSDVGGSIRQPSHYCGIVGLKPTHGRVPLTGHRPLLMQRFFHIGPMARNVRDVALAFTVLAGPDWADSYAVPVPIPEFDHLDSPLPRLRVGWCPEGPFAPVSRDVQETVAKAAATLAELGCEVEQVSLDAWDEWPAQSTSMSFFLGDGSHVLKQIVKGREDELTWYIQWRMGQPTPTLEDYMESITKTELLREDLVRFFGTHDLLLCPTSPSPAHPHDAEELVIDGEHVHGRNSLRATVPFDLTGSPAVTVPVDWSQDGLPIGVQLVGRHFDEATVLHAAAALEEVHASGRRPPV